MNMNIEELQIKLLENTTIQEVATSFGVSTSCIKNKIHKYKLTRNSNRKAHNKKYSIEYLRECVNKVTTKDEFKYNFPGLYSWCLREGIDIEKEFNLYPIFIKNFPEYFIKEILTKKLPQEKIKYNDRETIKPYELDVFFCDKNLAFEYDGKHWHTNSVNDTKKNNICLEKNILLIRIKEDKKDKISQMNNISDIFYNHLGILISEDDKKNIFYKALKAPNIEEELKKYKSLKELKKFNFALYNYIKIYHKDQLSIFDKPKLSDNDILDIIKSCSYRKDFIENYRNLYNQINKHKNSNLWVQYLKLQSKINSEETFRQRSQTRKINDLTRNKKQRKPVSNLSKEKMSQTRKSMDLNGSRNFNACKYRITISNIKFIVHGLKNLFSQKFMEEYDCSNPFKKRFMSIYNIKIDKLEKTYIMEDDEIEFTKNTIFKNIPDLSILNFKKLRVNKN